MIRVVAYVLSVALVIAAAVWLAGRPGEVTLTWGGWRVDSSVAFLALCVGVFSALVAVLYRFYLALRGAPAALRRAHALRRRERGYRALTQGMVAVAAGDAAEAQRHARRADALLGDPPLTLLLSAQAAQLGGDEAAARRCFTAMLERPETAFLGLRGLIVQTERAGDRAAALILARQANRQRPKTPWVLGNLFDLEIAEGQWTAALGTLEQAIRVGAVAQDEGDRRRAVVMLGASAEAAAAGAGDAALAHARRAHRLAPGLLPATIRLATLLVAADKPRAAAALIRDAWATRPHPDLARLYLDLDGAADSEARFRRAEKLAAANPGHPDSHLALARAAIATERWAMARIHLRRTGDAEPTAEICRLMAVVEEAEKGDGPSLHHWLHRAAIARPDPAWMCGACGNLAAAWQPRCAKCGALGEIDWSVPEHVLALTTDQAAAALAAPQGAAGGN